MVTILPLVGYLYIMNCKVTEKNFLNMVQELKTVHKSTVYLIFCHPCQFATISNHYCSSHSPSAYAVAANKAPLHYHSNNPPSPLTVHNEEPPYFAAVMCSHTNPEPWWRWTRKNQSRFPNKLKSSLHFPQAKKWPHLPVKITTWPGREALCNVCRL